MDWYDFKRPLSPELMKRATERQALLVLQHCFPEEMYNLFCADKPDLQTSDLSLGIEVTEMISRNDARLRSEFVKLNYGSPAPKQKERCRKIITELGAALDEDSSILYPVRHAADDRMDFINAVQHKQEKAKDYRAMGFQRLGLFVLCETPPIIYSRADAFEWFRSACCGRKDYDIVYLCYSSGLLSYDTRTESMNVSIIGRENYDCISRQARLDVEAAL